MASILICDYYSDQVRAFLQRAQREAQLYRGRASNTLPYPMRSRIYAPAESAQLPTMHRWRLEYK